MELIVFYSDYCVLETNCPSGSLRMGYTITSCNTDANMVDIHDKVFLALNDSELFGYLENKALYGFDGIYSLFSKKRKSTASKSFSSKLRD